METYAHNAPTVILLVQALFLAIMLVMFRKVWIDTMLVGKGFSVRIPRKLKERFSLSNKGCVHAVAEWMSRQEYNRDVWRVTLTYEGAQRVITTKTLAFYYGTDRKTGKPKLVKDDLIRNICAAVIDWDKGSRWRLQFLTEGMPEYSEDIGKPTTKYEIIEN